MRSKILPTITFAFLTSGCGYDADNVIRFDDHKTFDEVLLDMAQEIAAWSGDTIDTNVIHEIKFTSQNLNVELNDGKYDVYGICYRSVYTMWLPFTRRIVISYHHWKNTLKTPAARYFLMAHELGHCLLNRDHDENSKLMPQFMPDGFNTSTMTIEDVKEYWLAEVAKAKEERR